MNLIFLLLLSICFIGECHINKYHKKIPISCRQFCLALQQFQTIITPHHVFTKPILNTSRPLQYAPYNKNFLLYKKIAQGASAQVYLVQDALTEQMKIIKRYFSSEDKTQFQEQNYIAHQLEHDMKWSLSPLYNQTISIHPYSYVRNLSDLDVNERQIKLIMFKLIQEVQKAHDKGIIHSDIKSENILVDAKIVNQRYVTQKMKINLIDWNLASFYYIGKKYDRASGTPPFKAPQLVVQSEFYTPAIDIWSLGAVMFQVIAQKTLIPSDFDTEIIQMIKVFGFNRFIQFYNKIGVKAEPHFMHQIIDSQNLAQTFEQNISNPKFNDEQRKFIKKMLTFEPWDRPSCKQLLDDQYFDDIKVFDAPMSYKTKKKQQQKQEEMKQKQKHKNLKIKKQKSKQQILMLGSK